MNSIFDHLNGQARRVFQLAHREAFDRNHDYLGTEHVLLGMLREGTTGIPRLLGACQAPAAALTARLEELLPSSDTMPHIDKLPLTLALQRVLEIAQRQATALGQNHVGPEHLLLGILQEEDSQAAQALAAFGLTAAVVQESLQRQPIQENRDLLVQESQRPGASGARSRDPSAQELLEWLTLQVLPQEMQAEAQPWNMPAAAPAPPSRQLILTQLVLAVVLGAFICAELYGWRGVPGGILVGALVGSLRNSLVSAVAGGAGGLFIGWQYRQETILIPALGFTVGAFLGSWVGDYWKGQTQQ